MASVIRPLAHYPLSQLLRPKPPKSTPPKYNLLCTKVQLPPPHALRLRDAPPDAAEYESEDESNMTRNEKKRAARRAFRWGMDLANFSTTQIKRIIKVASLQREILDEVSLVKRLGGRDVREAKRRQFNLIGKMLREVEPELMDSLLQATIESDKTKFEKLFGVGSWDIKEVEDDAQDIENEDIEEDSRYHNDMVERWYNGLINKDIDITNEVYSLHDVEFDRQELRRLVRRVHSEQGNQISSEEKMEEAEAKLLCAERSLTRFIRNIAKQIPDD